MRTMHMPPSWSTRLFSLLDHFNSRTHQVFASVRTTPLKKKKTKNLPEDMTVHVVWACFEGTLSSWDQKLCASTPLQLWTCFCGLWYWLPGKVDVTTLCIFSVNMHLGSLAFSFHFTETFLLGSTVSCLVANPVKPSLSLFEHLGSFAQLIT